MLTAFLNLISLYWGLSAQGHLPTISFLIVEAADGLNLAVHQTDFSAFAKKQYREDYGQVLQNLQGSIPRPFCLREQRSDLLIPEKEDVEGADAQP